MGTNSGVLRLRDSTSCSLQSSEGKGDALKQKISVELVTESLVVIFSEPKDVGKKG